MITSQIWCQLTCQAVAPPTYQVSENNSSFSSGAGFLQNIRLLAELMQQVCNTKCMNVYKLVQGVLRFSETLKQSSDDRVYVTGV